MIRFLTAGESHGKALSTIVEGFPSNLHLTEEYINIQLQRRQLGYGRGLRMKMEPDYAEVISGLRFEKTLGSPVSMIIRNKDWDNWVDIMSPYAKPDMEIETISMPRPGHADLVGVQKYNFDDIRNSIERSSARETAGRVAACSVARRFLEEFDIHVGSFVESTGGIYPQKSYFAELCSNNIPDGLNAYQIAVNADKSQVRVLEEEQENCIVERIRDAKKNGDTLGGTFVTLATGLPAGLGTYMHYDRRLDTKIAAAMMSVNAVKAVEIGEGFLLADKPGSLSHDEIILKGDKTSRKTNRAGGIEGGISTGLPVIVRSAMKPIATLMSPIGSVELKNMNEETSRRERSDFAAVAACAVISESMLAWVLAELMMEKFGGDSIEETRDNYTAYCSKLNDRLRSNFRK